MSNEVKKIEKELTAAELFRTQAIYSLSGFAGMNYMPEAVWRPAVINQITKLKNANDEIKRLNALADKLSGAMDTHDPVTVVDGDGKKNKKSKKHKKFRKTKHISKKKIKKHTKKFNKKYSKKGGWWFTRDKIIKPPDVSDSVVYNIFATELKDAIITDKEYESRARALAKVEEYSRFRNQKYRAKLGKQLLPPPPPDN